MTIRKIIDDIRNHAGSFLADVRLRPMVRFAGEGSLNDIVVFQSPSGREHVVSLAVSRDAGDDAWEQAMIAPLNTQHRALPVSPWELQTAAGVRPDDIVFLKDFGTVEKKVGAIVEHIVTRGDEYVPRDEPGSFICTDARISTVVSRLLRVAQLADGQHDVSISGQELASGDQIVDTVTLEMDDGRVIDVTLESASIVVAITSSSGDLEFRISGMDILDQAMEQVEEKILSGSPAPTV